ncbi:hypothetical protein [Micromonospora siamensis]|uniref:Uncharacterized protein n=1 Tax=Micromonospora siamensis TaxID=299152 RepID=A0A1C5GW75_9ACTN|nr:hypothetical protein [Micromonospora siamensis]SCG38035.1 hypothetical protein GA0074704_0610 [Micromonospora siamensis]
MNLATPARSLRSAVRRSRALLGTGAVLLALGAAGCATAPAASSTAAPSPTVTATTVEVAPSPSVSPSTPAAASPTAATTSPRTPTRSPSASPSSSSRLVFDPDGLGELKLGMTKEQALATGMIRSFQNEASSTTCLAKAELKGVGGVVWWSTERGIVVIAPATGVQTVQGLHVGSSRDAVVKVYPEWAVSGDENGRLLVAVPGNPDARFRIAMANQKVTSIALQHTHQGCYE